MCLDRIVQVYLPVGSIDQGSHATPPLQSLGRKLTKEGTPYEGQIADLRPTVDPVANCSEAQRTPRVVFPASVGGKYGR